MTKNTHKQIHKAYEIAKNVYLNKFSISEGANTLTTIGLKKSSGLDYIYAYSKLIQGKLYRRTINAYATDYYLERIYIENGINALKTALISLKLHIEYYEETSGASVIKGRKIYEKYHKLIKNNSSESILLPDEMEQSKIYSEGKTRIIRVNSYERNKLARQECIEHFGLNCQVCDFNFQQKFGTLGQNFIHVHHIIDISVIGEEYSVDPKNDLIPVCPNCHAMLHKKKPAYTISELKKIIKNHPISKNV